MDLKRAEMTVRNLKSTGKQYERAVGEGLSIVVSASTGMRTWFFTYKVGRKNRRVKLGVYPHTTAKAAYEALVLERARVKSAPTPELAGLHQRVQATKPRKVADLIALYKAERLNTDAIGASWREAVCRYLDNDVAPLIGDYPLKDLSRDVVVFAIKEKLQQLTAAGLRGTAANQLLLAISGMLNWAAGRDYCAPGLLAGIKKPVKPKERKRVLSTSEVGELWNMLEACKTVPRGPVNATYAEILQVLMLTGARISEIVGPLDEHRTGLSADDVDLKAKTITIDDGKTAGSTRTLPMPPALLALVQARLAQVDDRSLPIWCYPEGENLKGLARKIPQIAVSRAAARVRRALKHEGWATHDLRRTAITALARLGVNGEVRRAVSGHKAGRDIHEAVYDQSCKATEMFDALTKLERFILDAALEARGSSPS